MKTVPAASSDLTNDPDDQRRDDRLDTPPALTVLRETRTRFSVLADGLPKGGEDTRRETEGRNDESP